MVMAISNEMLKMSMLYIASLGRTPDYEGLNFWTNSYKSGMSASSIANLFMSSAEGMSRYPSSYNNIQFLDAIYQNVLGRTPDTEGKLYWLGELNNGLSRGTFINTIIEAALSNGSDDGKILQNKASFGALSAVGGVDVAAATAKLSSITADSASVSSALVFDYSYTLTSNIDSLTGSSGSDTFSGTVTTTQANDSINGGDGTDTLKLTSTKVIPKLSSIESLVFSTISGVLDISTLSGVTLTTLEQPSGYTLVNLSTQALGLKNISDKNIDLTYTKAAKTATLAMSASTTTLDIASGEAIATVDITASGNSTLHLQNSGVAPITDINFLGSGSLTFEFKRTEFEKLKTLDATQNSGGISMTFTNSLDKSLEIFGGSGADSFDFGKLYSDKNITLDGGAGSDTLIVSESLTLAKDTTLLNVENIVLSAETILNLSSQTEKFTVTGSSENDTITLGTGSDIINAGAGDDIIYKNVTGVNDTVDGGLGNDTLIALGNLQKVGDSNIVNVETIQLSVAGKLDISDQTEGFRIVGSSGIDTITLGNGSDRVVFNPFDTLTSVTVDTINGFNLQSDSMDFSLFFDETNLGDKVDVLATPSNFTAGLDMSAGKTIGVMYNVSRALLATDVSTVAGVNKIALADDTKAIVFITKDVDGIGDNTVNNNYEMYAIWDATSGVGTSWNIVKVGVLNSTTEWNAADITSVTFV